MNPGEDVFIGVGSNIGDRAAMIRFGLERLRDLSTDGFVKASGIYETDPWGVKNQPKFLNCAARIHSAYPPEELLRELKHIEASLGRGRDGERWGAREIDLDILLFGSRVLDSPILTIPHPRIAERKFALVPLNELAPDVWIPREDVTVRQALERCPDPLAVNLYDEGTAK